MTIKDLKHPGLSQQEYYSEQQVSKHCPARMRKTLHQLHRSCSSCKEVVMDTVTTIQENAEDIYADAKQINEEREAAEEAVEDVAEETAEEAVEAEAEDTVEA